MPGEMQCWMVGVPAGMAVCRDGDGEKPYLCRVCFAGPSQYLIYFVVYCIGEILIAKASLAIHFHQKLSGLLSVFMAKVQVIQACKPSWGREQTPDLVVIPLQDRMVLCL